MKSCADHHYDIPVNAHNELLQVSLFLGVVCVVIGGLSRGFGDLIMGIINIILMLFQQRLGLGRDQPLSSTQFQVPKSIESALFHFNLNGHTVDYAICSACHCTYKPRISGTVLYPSNCTNKPHPDATICGEPLLKNSQPIKKFVYHEFNDYLAGLLARPDLEKIMDDPGEKLRNALGTKIAEGGDVLMENGDDTMSDVFDGSFMKTFPGPSGKNFFIECSHEEGRFAFTLHIDFFNPEGTNAHSASISCGIISLACLNLPAHLRYKPQNMYLAVIPGPREPSLTELNHYIRPLIDDMVKAWKRGIYFSKTALRPSGRLTKSAIAVVLCDLQAARKTSQMAPAQSHFYCSVCDCYHLSTLGRTDCNNWIKRDVTDLRLKAEAWKNASTLAEQQKLFNQNGIRWSELWRLPYWDPTRQLMVDSMHCLFEGLVKAHVLEVLKLRDKKEAEKLVPAFKHKFKEYDDTQFPQKLKDHEVKQIAQIHTLLTTPLDEPDDDSMTTSSLDTDDVSISSVSKFLSLNQLQTKLSRKNLAPLAFVYKSEIPSHLTSTSTLQRQKSKAELVEALLQWVGVKFIKHLILTKYKFTEKSKAT
jgi:hypothetical protein